MSKKDIAQATRVMVLVVISLLTSSLFLNSGATQSGHLTWAVRLFPDNPDYVEVFVEVRDIADKKVGTASFDVTFYDGSRQIRRQNISFLDQKLSELGAGSYHRFFKHENHGATRVQGGRFRAFGMARGADPKADSIRPLLAEGDSSDWNSGRAGKLIDRPPTRAMRAAGATRTMSASAPLPEIDGSKLYFIVSVSSGKVIDVQNRSLDDWTPVIQTTLEAGVSQQWRFEALHGGDEGYYHIRSSRSDKCLDVRLGETADSAAIIQYPCGDGDGQKWRLVAKGEGFQLQAKHSGKVIDVDGASLEDVPLIQYGAHSGRNQQWTIRETP